MLPLASISRRALVAIAALAAFAEKAEAASTPLAFVVATLSTPNTAGPDRFSLAATGALRHPVSGAGGTLSGTVFGDIRASSARARKEIKSQVRDLAVNFLGINNVTVAKDRIAIVLL